MFEMRRLEVSCAVRRTYTSLGAKGLIGYYFQKLRTPEGEGFAYGCSTRDRHLSTLLLFYIACCIVL